MDIKKFLEIEKKYALYSANIDGINYWNYSRVQIWNYEICTRKLNLQDAHPKKKIGFVDKIKIGIRLIKNSLWKGEVNQTDVLFLAHERRVKIAGEYKCIYTEPLAENFSNSVTLDMPYEYKHLKPESRLKRYYVDYILVASSLYYRLNKFFKTRHYKNTLIQIQEQMAKPLEEMLNGYNVLVKIETWYEILNKKLLIAEFERRLYDRLLEKFKPRLIVEVVYYGMHSMMLNELAKKKEILTIELQHGTMHKDHAAYQINWDETIPQLPDKIFLFSDFWKKRINLPIGNDNLVVTGFPYFEENKDRYVANRRIKTGKNILFISQGTIGDSLSKFAVEVADKLLPEGYRIIYKLHPAEIGTWEENYSHLKNTGIEVEDGRKQNIYECFAESDIQIGVYSTAIYEGLGYGLKTFIYNVGHADTLRELADEGYAQIVNDSGELIKLLREENVAKKGEVFWSDNSLATMTEILQELLIKAKEKKEDE